MLLSRGVATKPTVIALDAKLFMADIVPLLEHSGLFVVRASPAELDVASFMSLCNMHQPAFLLTVNFSPEVAFLCSQRGLTYVSWTVDPLPRSRWNLLPHTDPAQCVAFSHRRSLVHAIAGLGLEAHYLPLAASPRRTPAAATGPAIPVSFVGNSLAGEERALRRAVPHAEHGRLDTWLDSQPSELANWLEDDPQLADLAAGALSHRLRLHRVRTCLPLGVKVWGDDGWRGVGDAYQGVADHGDMLTDIYRRSLVNLDIPRLYQDDIVTMRVFDVLACGGVIVCEPASELSDMFDVNAHLATYRSTSELLEVVRTLLVDAPLRAQLSARGRAHVQAHHQLKHRVAAMLEIVGRRVTIGSS